MNHGNTEVMGLIGNPVAHTLSPLIHNTLAEQMKIDMVYVPFLVQDDLEAAIKGAYHLGMKGLNITVPYKSRVIPYLCEIDEKAAMMGAVNTLVRTEHGYKGYNTDDTGLYQALLSENINISESKAVIIGAGGAARAAAFLCAFRNAKKIVIANRTIAHASQIMKDVISNTGYQNISVMELQELDKLEDSGYLAIQATKVGLGESNDTPVTNPVFFQKLRAVYDLIYNPSCTSFMKLAMEQGVPAYNGLKMLLYQGITAFQLWENTTVTKTAAEIVYEKLKREMDANE